MFLCVETHDQAVKLFFILFIFSNFLENIYRMNLNKLSYLTFIFAEGIF